MGTTSRINLYRALAERLYRDKHWPITGTAVATTSTTSLKDTAKLAYSSGDANAFDRLWVYGMEAADASTRGYARVTEGGYSGSGSTLSLDPAITGLTSTDPYVITADPPTVLQEAINEVLRNIYVPCFFPLSMHIVGNDANDMEASTIATDYSNTNGTLTTESTIVHNGAQSLKVESSATGGYANVGSIGVSENKSLYAAVMCYVTSGDDATFRVVDVTDSNATIEDSTTDEPSWMELAYSFSTPSDCEQIDFRFISDANGDIAYWDDFQVWHSGQGVYPCPSWLTRRSQVIDVRAFLRGTTGPASDNDYRANERMSSPLDWDIEREDIRGDNPLHLWVEGTGGARPYIYALRPLSELSSDSATTLVDKDKVVFWAEKLIREPDKASETLALMRATILARPVTQVSRRFGVRIR